MTEMLTPDRAWQRLEPLLAPLPPETLPRRAAAGRVLAAAQSATGDVPAEDVSAMDGYAAGAGVCPGLPVPVVATVAAGDPPGLTLAAGQAARIMTGAPVPAGADRVIPVEASDRGQREVRFTNVFEAGAHLRFRGEILRRGDALLPAGSLLTPGALSLLATHGIGEVPVVRLPRVALITTGDEVVPPDHEPRPGQLRDSHSDFLLAACASLGVSCQPLGHAPDRRDALRELIRRGLSADVLLLTGGVSMGEFDLVEGVLAELGCAQLFDAVAIQPGKPLVAAHHQGGLVFGLPGNPASVMVSFWLFVRPALRRLAGAHDALWHGALRGELIAPLPAAQTRERFLPAEVSFRAGKILVRPYPPKGSHDVAAYAHGTALVRIPKGSPAAEPGAPCEVLPLADWRGAER